jgi:hypothetical protein
MMANDIDQKWWDIIKPRGNAQVGMGQPSVPGLSSPLMGYMQGGGLDRWMSNPRQPGQSSAPQAPLPMPQAPQPTPQPQAPQQGMMQVPQDPWEQLAQLGHAYIPGQGMAYRDPRWMGYGAVGSGEAAGVSGNPGNGPDGTDGGIY